MLSAGEPELLRPLSLGEIFDRAVTLYVREFPLFALITLVLVLPVTIMQYFLSMHDSAAVLQLLDQIQHPGKAPSTQSSAVAGLTFVIIIGSVVLGAFVVVAIAAAIGAIYRGDRPRFAECFGYAMRRAGAIVVTLLCEFASMVVLVFFGGFAVGVVLAAAYMLVRFSVLLGIAAFVVAALVVLAWFALILLCYLAFSFAFNALGIEQSRVGPAIGAGFARIFNRSEIFRAVLVCLALAAIYLGVAVVSLSVGALFESLHAVALSVGVSALVSLISTAFLNILLAIYYFDVRVRREGLDMHLRLQTLRATATAP